MDTLVAARDLVKRFPARGRRRGDTVAAVAGVSLDIATGTTLGLVGESGCGKSTLGRLLLRLIQPDSGSLSFEGLRLEGLGSRQLRALRPKMQIVLQNPYSALNPRLVVRQIVAFNLAPLGLPGRERRDRVQHAIHLVGLAPEILSRYPHQLSGGQAQRVGLARALVSEPRFIVADEIVSALDVSVQAEILALLLDLRSRMKLATLFISHNLHVVRYVSDRVAVMFEGRIVEAGSMADVYEDPHHPYTRLLLASAPKAGERQASLRERERLRTQLRAELAAYRSHRTLVEVAPGHLVETPGPATQGAQAVGGSGSADESNRQSHAAAPDEAAEGGARE
ncbi:MAG: ATP-binding cassette domain-containing protein [Candidatus Dormibacteraeota bacterium]|nr:ATP-binding cassette domain-containing protein [Candidatus Dormibacteraeota bacterium]